MVSTKGSSLDMCNEVFLCVKDALCNIFFIAFIFNGGSSGTLRVLDTYAAKAIPHFDKYAQII